MIMHVEQIRILSPRQVFCRPRSKLPAHFAGHTGSAGESPAAVWPRYDGKFRRGSYAGSGPVSGLNTLIRQIFGQVIP